MSSFIQIAVVLLLSTKAYSAPSAQLGYIDISPQQRVAYDSSIVDANKGTLILLPGIFRGLNRTDEFIKTLITKNINFVTIHFSTQPASVANYDAGKKLYFDGGKNVTSKGLAAEVETVIDTLKIKKPLIVTLSYSGSVTQYLNAKKYPVVIETSPIGRFDESEPDSAAAFKAWGDWFTLFGGGIFVQSAKDAAFRDYWGKVALQYTSSDKRLQSPESISRMTDGYIGMAKAVEAYDMREQNFATSPHRVFIFGENEEDKRKQIQLEAVEKYKKETGISAAPIIIKNAGHIVPNDQPAEFVQILEAILAKFEKL